MRDAIWSVTCTVDASTVAPAECTRSAFEGCESSKFESALRATKKTLYCLKIKDNKMLKLVKIQTKIEEILCFTAWVCKE